MKARSADLETLKAFNVYYLKILQIECLSSIQKFKKYEALPQPAV